MLSITSLLILLFIGMAVWFWQSSARAREYVIAVSKEACQMRNLQFLDDTTSIVKLSLRRNENGRLSLVRHYSFDYYDGQFRCTGYISISQKQVIKLTFANIEATPERNNVIPFPKKKMDTTDKPRDD